MFTRPEGFFLGGFAAGRGEPPSPSKPIFALPLGFRGLVGLAGLPMVERPTPSSSTFALLPVGFLAEAAALALGRVEALRGT